MSKVDEIDEGKKIINLRKINTLSNEF